MRKFLLVLVVGVVLMIALGGVFAVSYGRLKAKTPEAYFVVGKEYYDKGDTSSATLQFLNTLKRNASHRDSRYYLALCYLSQKDPLSAYRQLQALLEAHPDDVEARLRLQELSEPPVAGYLEEALQKSNERLLELMDRNMERNRD